MIESYPWSDGKLWNCYKSTAYNKTPFSRGLEYVQLSRSQRLEHIVLIGNKFNKQHFMSHEKERHGIEREYDRLKKLK